MKRKRKKWQRIDQSDLQAKFKAARDLYSIDPIKDVKEEIKPCLDLPINEKGHSETESRIENGIREEN